VLARALALARTMLTIVSKLGGGVTIAFYGYASFAQQKRKKNIEDRMQTFFPAWKLSNGVGNA
jgi:hypothetical protein